MNTSFIHLPDGRNLNDVIKEIESKETSTVGGTPVDLSAYAKTEVVDSKIEEVKAEIEKEIVGIKASIPSINGLAKSSDIVTLTNTLNQLIADLQAGKYNNASTTATNTSTVSK